MKAETQQQICSHCELALPPGLPEILCPRCALREADSLDEKNSLNACESFGDYQLLEIIGRGGMGVVYAARQLSLDRIVALKVLLRANHSDANALRRFHMEARAAGRLQHPNLVAVHEVGIWNQSHFLVMDFVEGHPLSALARDTALPSDKAARYTLQIARAIEYAHQHAVLHRDLKPSNVLIDLDDNVRVTDFGLARSLDEDSQITISGQPFGSPGYMSPEQARGLPDKISRSTDIYSIGAILYHLLTGAPPFRGSSLAENVHAIINDIPKPLCTKDRDVPLDLAIICLKCLAKEPGERYMSAGALADDLGRFLHNEPIHARPPSLLKSASHWCKRNPAVAALIMVLAAGSVLLGTALYNVIIERNRKNEAIRIITEQLTANIEEFWRRDDQFVEEITSETLAALAGDYKQPAPAGTLRLRLAIKAPHSLDLQKFYRPLLQYLESSLERSLRQPLRIDVALSKRESHDRVNSASNSFTISRMGAAKYIGSQNGTNSVLGLVQEIAIKEANIFVRRDSPIRNLADLSGESFAFADRRSTLSQWAKVALVRAGITGRDLRWKELSAQSPQLDKDHSHKPCIDAVLDGTFAAGVARSKYVREYPELRAIYTFESDPNIWVITGPVSEHLRQALVNAFVGAEDPALFQSGPTEMHGFEPIDREKLQELADALDTEVVRFHQP